MSLNDSNHEIVRHSRIRRVKKVLRYMPRRATLHRYPFLKWFANFARKRPYLWSFRVNRVVPALYAGFILTFVPLYGVQIPVAFTLALLCRANLMVLVGLQFISNPVTVPPIYYIDYQIGHFILSAFDGYNSTVAESFQAVSGKSLTAHGLLAIRYFMAMFIGGSVIGYFSAFISSFCYQFFARKLSKEPPK